MDDLKQIEEEILKERAEMEQRKYAPPKPSRIPVVLARWAWALGTLALDGYTAWIFATLTTWFYGALWVVIGAGGLLYWDAAVNRIGNNDDQDAISAEARIVSVIAIAVMAVVAGALLLLGVRANWIPVGIEVVSVGLFVYHMIQLYRYYDADDERRAQKEDALAEARAQREIASADRAARRIEAKRRRIERDGYYRRKYGPAYDAARGDAPLAAPMQRQFAQTAPKPPSPLPQPRPNPPQSSPSEE